MPNNSAVHLIMLPEIACTPDWVGKTITTDLKKVTCLSCRNTDYFKLQKSKNKKSCLK
jgi:hypothetical protein